MVHVGKHAEIQTCLEMDDQDLIIGCESWLDFLVNSSGKFPSTYNVFRKDRPPNKKGCLMVGVLIAVKNNIICFQRLDLDTNCEIIWIEIKITGTKPILVGSYYRPPSSDRDYLNSLRDSLAKINPDNFSNIWLGGDFNLGDIVWETQSVRKGAQKPTLCRDLINISNDYGLDQVVTKPTKGKNTLDLFFIKNPSLVVKSTTIPGISDHDSISLILGDSKPYFAKQKPRSVPV